MNARLVLLAALAIEIGWTQVGTGTLLGDVHDASGAAVGDVQISIVNEATGFSRTSKSGTHGEYRVDDLQPGKYVVAAEKAGFRRLSAEHINIEVNQQQRLDLNLVAGEQHDSVTVTAQAGILQTSEPSEGYTLDSSTTLGLPVEGRNIVSMVTVGPGAIPRQLGGFVHDIMNDLQGNRGAVALNAPVNGARSNRNSYVLDGAYDTDQNVFAIAVVPPMDSVQEFRIQSLLSPASAVQAQGAVVDMISKQGSRSFHGSVFEFLHSQVTDARGIFDDPTLAKPTYRQNQFGASIGGPVPGSKSTFFYGSYEGLRNLTASDTLHNVPDPGIRGGDFTGRQVIYDPLTLDATGARVPFANNIIPANRIDPIATKFLSLYEPFSNHGLVNGSNYIDATPSTDNSDNGLFRVDHQFGGKGLLFARYTFNNEREHQAGAFPELPTDETLLAQQAAVGYTSSFGRWLNQARLSFTRLRVFDLPESAFQSNVIQQLGIVGGPTDPFTYGLPFFVVSDFDMVTDSPTLPQEQRDNTWSAADGLSMTRGRNTIQTGFQWVGFQMNYLQSQYPRGQYQFDGVFTSSEASPSNTGDAFADFLLGFPQATSRFEGNAQGYLRRSTTGLYVQDSYRVRPNFTIDAGLRWEYFSPFSDARGNLLNLNYASLPAQPTLMHVGQSTRSEWNDFSPRLGIAWRLPWFVFRAGYGIYFQPEIAIESYDLVFNGLSNQVNQVNGFLPPVLTTRDGFPQTPSSGFPTYFGLDPNARTPYAQQWNGGFQREFRGGVLVEASYIGTKGTHLGRFRTFNTPAHIETGEDLGPRPGDLQSLRTFPDLGPIYQRQNIANSIYHSLQLKAEKRYGNGLSFLTSFVWAKSIDDADSPVPGEFESFGAQDERNLRLERGLSFFDVRYRFTAGFLYQVPHTPVLSRLLSRWEFSGILTSQTGTPLNPVYFSEDFANSGTPNRPNVVLGQNVNLPSSQRTINQFFNTAAFSDPAPYTFGDAGRNILPGPANNVANLSVHRNFRTFEHQTLQLRAEAFNALNHPNWGIPGSYPDFGPFFGKIFAAGDQRRLQFGLRYDF